MRTADAVQPSALAARLTDLGFSLPEEAARGLGTYLSLLMKWNKAMNLVGTHSWEETLDTLAVDSFHLANFLPGIGLPPSPETFDLGAGAGLPGIPLRLVWQEGRYTLVEAREKRALFMRTALASLSLGQTTVFTGRAEKFFMQASPADCIVSRAFMPWQDMLGFIKNALAPCGRIVFLTLTPAPGDIPEPWRLVAEARYEVMRTPRHFWCFARSAA